MRNYIHPKEFYRNQIVWVRLETEFKQPIMVVCQILSVKNENVEVQALTDDSCVYVSKSNCYEIQPGIL